MATARPARPGAQGLLAVALALAVLAARGPARLDAQAPDCDPPLPHMPYIPPLWDLPDASAYAGVTRDLRNEGLSAVPTEAWAGQEHLQALLLRDNALTTLPPDAFVGLPRLQVLTLSGNELTQLPPRLFRPLSCLQTLSLDGNALTTLPPDLFRNLNRLERLHLNGNALTTLPPDLFRSLDRLQTLYLDGNALTTLPPDLFRNLDRLERLDLDGNALTTLPPDLFRSLDRLQTLLLRDNALTTLPPGLFHNLDRLERLNLDGNALTTLPPGLFRSLDRLQTLSLGGNALTTLPPGLFAHNTPRLKSLNLSSNALTALPPDLFRDLDQLESLGLAFNQLACLPPDLFRGPARLRDLRLDYNRLGNPAPAFLQALGLAQGRDLVLGPETDRGVLHRQTRPYSIVSDLYSENNLPQAVFARYAAVVSGLEALTLSADAPLTYPLCPAWAAPASAARAVRFAAGAAGPQVGRPLAAETVPPEAGPVAWRWERCADAAGHRCRAIGDPADPKAVYVPGPDDAGRYLRAHIPYLAPDGAWTRLQSSLAGPVAPQRCPARRGDLATG